MVFWVVNGNIGMPTFASNFKNLKLADASICSLFDFLSCVHARIMVKILAIAQKLV